jgi:predicted alpha/beta superfamily hydrolase
MPGYSKLFYLLLFTVVNAHAQFAAPIKDSLESAELHEKRDIAIILPANYTTDTTRYDVWYVLDGEWNSKTFTNIFNYEVAIGFAPPVIIVSVPNRYVNGFNLRDRDFTPTYWKDVDSSGGADRFLDFFERELMPYIQSKYRTSGESGLFGTSFGGVFTMYVLLQKPSLFRFYTMGDPALQFDDKFIPRLASNKLKQMSFHNTVLNIGGRSGFSYSDMGRDLMDSILRSDAPAGLHWHSALYDDETHGSSVFKSNYDGIKYAYLGYSARNATYHLTSGVVLPGHPVRFFVPTDHTDMRYATDGRNRNTGIRK